MDFVYAAGLLGTGFISFCLLLRATRRPVRPWWAGAGMMENVWCVAFIGLAAFGVSFLVRGAVAWQAQVLGWSEGGLIALIAAACVASARSIGARGARAGEATVAQPAQVLPFTPPPPPPAVGAGGPQTPSRAA